MHCCPAATRSRRSAVQNAVQLYLNPGLPAYPDFVAGQAVRSTLSPDGTTLAVITAGQNSLYKADGTVDAPNSTQYVFLYDVRGEHKRSPALLQVLKQTNAHVGLVFAPDGGTLYATGGSDDAVYVYTRSGSSFSSAGSIPLGHYPPGATGNARQKGLGIGVQPNAAGLDVSADGKTLVVANNYNDSISGHRHGVPRRPLRARPASVLRRQRRTRRPAGGHLSVRRGDERQRRRLRVIGSRSRSRGD